MITAVYYINLDHRTDRDGAIRAQCNTYGLSHAVRVPGIKTNPGGLGCTMSHIAVLERFLQTSHDICIVLEDDFQFTESPEFVASTLASFFQTKRDWDVLFLAANLRRAGPIENRARRVIEAQTASGYLVNKRYASVLLDNLRNGLQGFESTLDYGRYAMDQYWKPLQTRDKWYVCEPRLGRQRPGYSDIEGNMVDYGC